jgi:hypothetical protein
MSAVGQLTGLVSLELWPNIMDMPLQHLTALQRLTSLALRQCRFDEQQARVLAGLRQLRRLATDFCSPAVAAAAGLTRLEECRVDVFFDEDELPRRAAQAPGHLRTNTSCLAGFDLSSVHTLELVEIDQSGRPPRVRPLQLPEEAAVLRHMLSRCPQLRAADLIWFAGQPEAQQAIAALPQLQHLCLRAWPETNPQLDCGRLAVLAGCSRQLRQLTLRGMADLPESTLMALMAGLPQLRLLRLLGCIAALSQERCQALVGQLQLYKLQVDVASARAQWMIKRLAER